MTGRAFRRSFQADVIQKNGVVQVIDKVLMPKM